LGKTSFLDAKTFPQKGLLKEGSIHFWEELTPIQNYPFVLAFERLSSLRGPSSSNKGWRIGGLTSFLWTLFGVKMVPKNFWRQGSFWTNSFWANQGFREKVF